MFKTVSKNEWEAWYDKIYGYLFRRLENRTDVEDLTSEVLNDFFMTKVEVENPNSFIFSIAKNKLNTFLKSKYKHNVVDGFDEITDQFGFTPEFEKFKSDLQNCVSKHLTPQNQEIVNLCIVEDFQSKMVAKKLNLSPENVRIKLHRSLKILKEKCKHLRQI